MMKKTLIALLLLTLTLAACGKVDLGFGEKEPVSLAAIEMDDLVLGLPAELPSGLELYEGTDQNKVYVDTSISDNFFYSTDASVELVSKFYRETLVDAGWELLLEKEMSNYTSLQFKKGEERLNVSVYSKVPASYPSKLDLKGTFVTVLYNFDTPQAP